ncbi:unnamed protein product [Rotaria socialis]|uniref:MULE transposase domain-containing protein n=1 Tax=Rotaria socialis TaxID=392032 RepID=A0A821VH48_9BILA|nr:unnamed protein product [Rotaria socialis]CAF4906106.1 unnamed protein product [Rotaria socialis]
MAVNARIFNPLEASKYLEALRKDSKLSSFICSNHELDWTRYEGLESEAVKQVASKCSDPRMKVLYEQALETLKDKNDGESILITGHGDSDPKSSTLKKSYVFYAENKDGKYDIVAAHATQTKVLNWDKITAGALVTFLTSIGIGAAVGTMAGPIGTAIGAAGGAVVGGVAAASTVGIKAKNDYREEMPEAVYAYLFKELQEKQQLAITGSKVTLQQNQDLKDSDKVIWCCRNYRHGQCRGRLHTINNQVIQIIGDHNHEPSSSDGQVAAARTRMSDSAKQSCLTTHTIVADAVSKLSDNAISSLPNLQNLKRNVRKIRQRSQNPLSLPTTRDSIVIDPQYTITARDRTFLHFDSGSIDQRILIFSTKKQLKILENANYIYLDGTFSVVPELYFQLYTIHATYFSHIIPVVYILLTGKKQRLYKEMFQQIKNLIPNFDPPNIMIDYERATINEIKKQFPSSNVSVCFFHLCQNVYRAVIRFGLKALYSEDEDFAKQIRSLPTLALLPAPDVIPTFDEIKAQFPAEGEPVLKYFGEYYIGVKGRLSRPRKAAKFDILLWNSPQFLEIFKWFKKKQSYVEGEIIQALAGVRKSRRVHQIRQEKRILNIMNEPTITNFENVMALAHIISLKKS